MNTDLTFNGLMNHVLSTEGKSPSEEDGVKGIKLDSLEDFPESGVVNIDLGDLKDTDEAVASIRAAITTRGLKLGFSPESFHSDDNVKYVDPEVRTEGLDNLVVNGEYIPDTMKKMMEDAHVKVVTPKTKLMSINKDLIYYIIDDPQDVVYKTLTGEGLIVARTPLELGEALNTFRHQKTYEV